MRQTPRVRRPPPEPALLPKLNTCGGPVRSRSFSLSTECAAAATSAGLSVRPEQQGEVPVAFPQAGEEPKKNGRLPAPALSNAMADAPTQ